MTVTKQQVIAALAEQRVNRPRHLADQNIRNLLRTYGGGATNIGELSPDFYFYVFCAAGGAGSVCAPVQREREPWDVIEDAPPASRARTALVADLQARLAERAGKPRQFPKGRIDTGNASQPGDRADDAPFNPPAGEKMS